ncbi:NAD-dependent epimerase/dehydratase family protein [bacterium]|nr:NAD-dependent epimerase/dehydratase family protein [bacterium]
MTALVTGATGFIGARLVEALLAQGCHVHALCRQSSDASGLLEAGVTVYRGELTSASSIANAMRGCDRVYHLASFAGNWSADPEGVRRENLKGMRVLLAVARAMDVRRVVYTSTIMTYGPSNGSALSESTRRTAAVNTLYEQCKADAEEAVEDAVQAGQDIVVLHPTRVFGPGKLTEANSTTIMMRQYLRGTWRSIPGAGNAIGNYVYVDDVVSALLAAMERGKAGQHYIVGGTNLTYAEFFALLARKAGRRRVLIPIPRFLAKAFAWLELLQGKARLRNPSITPAWVDVFYDDWSCSCARARAELGYHPTSMDDAFAATLGWLRPQM